MKRLIVLVVTCLSALVMSSTIVNAETVSNPTTENVTENQYESNVNSLNKIGPTELFDSIANKETFYVYFGYKECRYCREFSPTLAQASKDKQLNILYFDLDQGFDPNMMDRLGDYFENDLKMTGTPTVAYYKDGELINKLSGAETSLKDLKSMSIQKAN